MGVVLCKKQFLHRQSQRHEMMLIDLLTTPVMWKINLRRNKGRQFWFNRCAPIFMLALLLFFSSANSSPFPLSQWITWRSLPWIYPQPRCSTSSMGMSVEHRDPGRLGFSRTSPTQTAASHSASAYLTPSTKSSRWSRMPGAGTCCTMARDRATAPAPTDPRREPLPTRCL